MIFRRCKYQNRNFSQTEAQIFEGLLRHQNIMRCFDFFYICDSLNEENFKPNFVSFGVNLKEL
jgi:hypothetical protein